MVLPYYPHRLQLEFRRRQLERPTEQHSSPYGPPSTSLDSGPARSSHLPSKQGQLSSTGRPETTNNPYRPYSQQSPRVQSHQQNKQPYPQKPSPQLQTQKPSPQLQTQQGVHSKLKEHPRTSAPASRPPSTAMAAPATPWPFTQGRAAPVAPHQPQQQPVYHQQTGVSQSKTLPKTSPQAGHVQQTKVARPQAPANRSPAVPSVVASTRKTPNTPVPITREKASVASQQQHQPQPVYHQQAQVPPSKVPPKTSPQAEHVQQTNVPQSQASSGRTMHIATPATATREMPVTAASSTPEKASLAPQKSPPLQTKPSSLNSVPDSKPITAPISLPATSNVTTLSNSSAAVVEPAPATTENNNANLANQASSSSGLPKIGIAAITVLCMLFFVVAGTVLYRIWQRYRQKSSRNGVRPFMASHTDTNSDFFGGRERSVLDFTQRGDGNISHPSYPSVNEHSEHHISLSDPPSNMYGSGIVPALSNAIRSSSNGSPGNKMMDSDATEYATPVPKSADIESVKSSLAYRDGLDSVGSVFLVERSFDPNLPDELMISPGDRVQVDMKYDDGWCFGTNLDAELRRLGGHNSIVSTGVFPLECLRGPTPVDQETLASDRHSQLSEFSMTTLGSGSSSNEMLEHINIFYRTPSLVPNITIDSAASSDSSLDPNGPLGRTHSTEHSSDTSTGGRNTQLLQELGNALGPE